MMAHNALSRSLDRVPMWLVQTVVATFLTAAVAWTTWASVTTWKHDTRITVVEDRIDTVKRDLSEIKEGQREINHKLDRLIDRRR